MISVKKYKSLPNEPGCYIFKDKNKLILYVGKANNLKKRVTSYFTKKDHDVKTQALIEKINSIDFFITKNEIEALILENNLIKRYYPKYNIDLKDSRRYAYLYFTKDKLPQLKVARKRSNIIEYFGPFTLGRKRQEIIKILERNFGIITKKPSNLKIKSINIEEYYKNVKKAIKILKGNVERLISSLKKEMKEASKKTNYEYALTIKKQIEALNYLKEKQNMELRRNYDADIINFIKKENKVHLLIFNIYKGILENKQEFEFKYEKYFFEDFLIKYYSNNPIPKEIILPYKIKEPIINFLSKKTNSKIKLVVPKKAAKKALLDLVLKNIKISLYGENQKLFELKKSLNLKKNPVIIECFDISHLKGNYTVASMVTFINGKQSKGNYRKFKIKTETKGDDFKAIREVIYRRYSGSLKDTLPLPDLIVIDGGAGQLSSALSILKELNLKIPIISLAKKLEEIYLTNRKNPLRLNKKNKGLLLLRKIRDEAHRFAISYNRLLRKKFYRSRI